MFEKENEIMLEFAKSLAPVFMQEVLDYKKNDVYVERRHTEEEAIRDTIYYAEKLTKEYFNNQID